MQNMAFCRARSAHGPSIIFSAQSGFTLVELAIVVLITGLILVAAASVALPLLRETRMITTEAKIDRIAKTIDFYATQNYRVPCPAKPLTSTANFGAEQANTNAAGVSTTCTATFGIVPFLTLGIPADWARDAWGNYITYAISPAFSQDTTVNFPVHPNCRTADWYNAPMTYEPGNSTQPQYEHKNPAKARFCCPYPAAFPPSTDLTILDVNGNSQLAISRASGGTIPPAQQPITPAQTAFAGPPVVIPPTKPCAGQLLTNLLPEPIIVPGAITIYPDPTVTYTGYAITASADNSTCYVPGTDRPTAPVYVLVSHGANGFGAYNVNIGVRNSLAGATADEKMNASDTGTFYEIPPLDRTSTKGEMTFDDFVLWRTQDLIFASQGKTCASP
jgi:prepilin-type N-terminal cleavage/methylation domain-containing protein